jgi:hypothetical protein
MSCISGGDVARVYRGWTVSRFAGARSTSSEKASSTGAAEQVQPAPPKKARAIQETTKMKKTTLALLAVATVAGSLTMTPAQAQRGWVPALPPD